MNRDDDLTLLNEGALPVQATGLGDAAPAPAPQPAPPSPPQTPENAPPEAAPDAAQVLGEKTPGATTEPPDEAAGPSYDDIDQQLGLPPAQTGLAPLPDDDAGFWETFSAGWRAETVRTDAWNYTEGVRSDLRDRMWRQLSSEARQRVMDVKWDQQNNWMLFEDLIAKELAAQAQADPDAAGSLAGLPLSIEAFEAQVLATRKQELEGAQDILDQPGGGVAGFLGMATRSLTDEASLALLPFGITGTLRQVVMREAALGAAFEAAVLPREFQVAEELDLADPDALSRIALGATLGGALGGAIHGAGLLITRARTRRAATRDATPPGVDDMDAEAAIDAAEAQMYGERTVAETIGAPERGTLGDILIETGTRATVRLDNAGAIRSQPIQPALEARLSQAVGEVYGPGYEVRVYSGGQPGMEQGGARTGSKRHDHGGAADVRVFGPDGRQVSGDGLAPLAQYWAAKRFGGVGLEMKGGGIHLDIHEKPPAGGGMAWNYADQGGNFTPAQAAAVQAGLRGELPTLGGQAGATPTIDLTPTPGLSYNEPALLDAIIGAESGGRATAQNPNSSALGPGQIISGTWMELIRKNRPDLLEGRTPSQVLELRTDPELSRAMTAAYARENHARLKAEGLQSGPAEIYLAHFLGPNDAVRMLRGAAETPISQILSPKVMTANKGVKYRGRSFAQMSAFDLRMWSRAKMKSAYGEGPPASGSPQFGSGNRGYTGQGQVRVSDDMTIDVTYEVVDLTAITRASGQFQPRDRTGANSDAWIADTAARLDPAQLMPAPTAAMGPPIVGRDGMIESGNGRYGAIERAFERHPERTAAYRDAIESAGFAIPEGVERPILIARRDTELTTPQRVQLAIDAQDSGVAQMTPTEIAMAFGRAMDVPILARFNPELALTDAGNGEFVRSLLSALPRSARNAMATKEGALNRYGQDMLHEAIFARAWDDPDIVSLFIEATPGDMKGLLDALEKAVPPWAALKSDIEAGLVRPEFDISGHVLDAMRLISAARAGAKRDGIPVNTAMDELLNTPDMLAGPVAPLTTALVSKFWRGGRAAPSNAVADFLTRYANDARKAGRPGDLFDAAPTPGDVLRRIDPETFRDLPDDFGAVRGFARKEAPPAAMPPRAADGMGARGFDDGATSPQAAEVGATIRADLEGPAPARDGGADVKETLTVDPAPPARDAPPGAADELAAARTELARFDEFEIKLADGSGGRVHDVLDDLDGDAGFDAFVQACGLGGAR